MKRFAPYLAVFITLIIAAASAWLLFASPALAQEDDFPRKGTVLREASLRTGPGLRFEIVSRAEAGLELTIIDANATGEWYLLQDDLWISASLVELEGEEAPPTRVGGVGTPTRTPAPTRTPRATRTPTPAADGSTILLPAVSSGAAVAATTTGVVLQNSNLRAGPGVGYAIVGKAPQGTVLTIVGANAAGDWLQTDAGQWIAAFLVNLRAPLVNTVVATATTTTTIAAPALLIRPLLTFTEPLPAGSVMAKVVAIVEGDVIRVEFGGATEEVRYVGIDAPDAGVAGFQTAQAANQALVGGATVYLAAATADRDSANRLLRYVYTADGHLVSAELLAQGWALPLLIPADFDRGGEFNRITANAALTRRGFWSGASPFGADVAPYAMVALAGAIYAGPGTNNPTVGDVTVNTALAMLGRTEDNAWVQARLPSGTTGWIYAPQITPNVPISQLLVTQAGPSGPAPAVGSAVAPTPMPVVGTATVVNPAEFRTGPGTQFTAAGNALPGSTVAVVGRSADSQWFMLDTGLWIPATSLVNAPLNAPITEPIATPTPALPVVGQAAVLSQAELRSGPGMQFPVTGVATAGSNVNIVGRSADGGWYLTDTGGWLTSFSLFNPPTTAPVIDPSMTPTPTPPGGGTLPVVATANVIVQTDFRTGPGFQFPSVNVVNPGAQVNIVGRSADNQWFFTDQNVWVLGQHLDNQPFQAPVTDGATGGATPTPAPTPLPVVGTLNVIVQTDLRAGPGEQFALVTQVFPGATLDVSGRTTDGLWYLTSAGSWVSAAAVTNIPPNVPVTEPTPTPLPGGLVVAGNGDVFVSIALRAGPGEQFLPVGFVEAGTVLPIVGRSTDGLWYLTANGSWILAAAVTNAPAQMPILEPTPTPFGTPPPPPTALVVGPTPTPTATFPPPPPTITPTPTITPAPALSISRIDRIDDWVIIMNQGGSGADLTGWTLAVEGTDIRCPLQGIVAASSSLRVWAGSSGIGGNQLNCYLTGGMFAGNSSAALLLDMNGATVARAQ
jgi:uncharacterized protein YraI